MNYRLGNLVVLSVILGTAAVLSVASYQFATASTNQILEIASKDIRSNTEIQAHDLSTILVNKISAINNNLRVIASSPAFVNSDGIDTGKTILAASQDATKDLTELYFWLDKDGRLVWSTSLTPENASELVGADRSFREYFTGPRDNGAIHYSTTIVSVDNIPRKHIAVPIYDATGEFKGVIVAGIRLEVLGKFLQSQISPNYAGNVGMMDRNGIILYSSNSSLIGKYVFGDEFQSRIPEGLKESFDGFLRKSLGGGSGVEDLSYEGRTGSLAYETITIEGKDFGVVYVTAPHNFASSVISLVDAQRTLSLVTVVVIGSIAAAMSVLVLFWNKQLAVTVRTKTHELEFANERLKAKSAELEGTLGKLEQSNRELELANEQLKTHDKLQQEFINIAAHELRTPIQPIISMAEVLESYPTGPEEDDVLVSKKDLWIIRRNAARLERLTSDILDVSRIETGSFGLNIENFDLAVVVNETMEDAKRVPDTGDLKIMRLGATGPIEVSADRHRIRQVLTNLVNNAIRFAKPSGTISIALHPEGDRISVIVHDTGPGIPSDIMSKLFTKFSSSIRAGSGTGLGLYISKAIVEAHGGSIWGENNPDGKGASFGFEIPIRARQIREEQSKNPALQANSVITTLAKEAFGK